MLRTSENSFKANFGECPFSEVANRIGRRSPAPILPLYCSVSYVRTKRARSCVHKKHNTRRYGRPLADSVGPIGCCYARFHAGANFALTEFSEDEMRRPTPCAVPFRSAKV